MGHRERLLEEAEEAFLLGDAKPGCCPYCKRDVEHLFSTPSMTLYHWNGEGEDPNRPQDLCLECSNDYVDMMEERWREYYGSVL